MTRSGVGLNFQSCHVCKGPCDEWWKVQEMAEKIHVLLYSSYIYIDYWSLLLVMKYSANVYKNMSFSFSLIH